MIGTYAHLLTKVALAKDRLDLYPWHGFHEILYKKKIELTELETWVRPESTGIHFIFGKDSLDGSGLNLYLAEVGG
jgi:hypothetical protein